MKKSTKAKLLCSTIAVAGATTSVSVLADDLQSKVEDTVLQATEHNKNIIVDLKKIAAMPMMQ